MKKETTEFKSSTWCIECKAEYDASYRNTEKIQNLYKSEVYRDRKKEYQKSRLNKDPALMMLIQARSRAKKQNVPFNIDITDIIIPEYCPLLGIKLERKPYDGLGKTGFQPCSPSLDKIIPELGYVKGNIMVISMKANIMKHNASIKELKIFANNIIKIYDNSTIVLSNTTINT